MLWPSDRFLITATAEETCEIKTESCSFYLSFFWGSGKSGITGNWVIPRTLWMSTVVIHGVISWAVELLGKPAVPVVSQILVCVAPEMIQLIITCPALYTVMKQELLACGEFCIPWFPLAVAERWCQYQRAPRWIKCFVIGVALKNVLSLLFSDHPTPGASKDTSVWLCRG